jgi:CHAT domain-containing protein/tetratricopeptide (TPR) repeat protein
MPGLLELVGRADNRYRAGNLLSAAELYQEALRFPANVESRHCFERLLEIYARVGRLDMAIRTGSAYAPWLQQARDWQRARRLNLEIGEWYLVLGHHGKAVSYLRQALEDRPGDPLPAVQRFRVWTALALAAEQQANHRLAEQYWRQVEALAGEQLKNTGPVDPRQKLKYLEGLAERYRFQDQLPMAIRLLETEILPLQGQLKDQGSQRDTLRLLARHLAAAQRLPEAESSLKRALIACAPSDQLTCADLSSELEAVLTQQRRSQEAQAYLEQALRDYRAVLSDTTGRSDSIAKVAAVWGLQRLYQRDSSKWDDAARKLMQDQAGQWGIQFLIEYRLKAEAGSMEVMVGEFERARPLLREAVTVLKAQSPLNLSDLPRALLNLAVVELVTRPDGPARDLGDQCRRLYQDYQLPPDATLVEVYNLLGTCAAQNGDYHKAIEGFREGEAVCAKLGKAAISHRCHLLLNIALLHKAQGDLEAAEEYCKRAQDIYRESAAQDRLGLAALDAARAMLLASQKKFDPADELASEVLAVCQKANVHNGPLVITAKHCRALHHLAHGDYARAEKTWTEVRKLQELQGENSPWLPRTLNYLALTYECQEQFDKAEELYGKASQLQVQNPRAFPVTQFNTLWRLARVLERRGRYRDARARLEDALDVVEKARLRTYGDAQQRATFLAQFEVGFEQLFEWGVKYEKPRDALGAAIRGRSRTLLDQLLMAGVDPRDELSGPKREELRLKEGQLRRQIDQLRARARLIPMEALASTPARNLLADFDQAQGGYADVYRDILDASRTYRCLREPHVASTLQVLDEWILSPKRVLLVYHVGRQQSYVLLLGQNVAETYPLQVRSDVAKAAQRVLPAPARRRENAQAGDRGLEPGSPSARPNTSPPLAPGGPKVPLDQKVLRILVDSYLQAIQDQFFQPSNGLQLGSSTSERPLPIELLADVLLPGPVRKRLSDPKLECVVLIPDDALHKLPFEALVLKGGDPPVYALDQLRPLVYAPSVAVLGLLARGPSVAAGERLSLLTVANPAYRPILGGGNLSKLLDPKPLPSSAQESERIQCLFDRTLVTALSQQLATAQKFRAALRALRGRPFILHIAAHGFPDDRYGNAYGFLALTPPPPGQDTADNNGCLELREIYQLHLKDCELAVLSACGTNVGPQQPLEAGVTLASGFLAAGARRVVASHWSVADQTTADLMEEFFREVTAASRTGKPIPYAQLLQQARKKVREECPSPRYWAPFVLIGTPQ